MAPSEQPESSLAHARISLAALALALFVGILVGGLVYYDPPLETVATKILFLVGVTLSVVCMLVGISTLAIDVFKRFDKFWSLAALFGAPLIIVTAYDTYAIFDLSQTVTNVSKEVTNISATVTKVSNTVTHISETKCQPDDSQEDSKLVPPPTSDSQSQPIPPSDSTPSALLSETVPPPESTSSASLQSVKNPLLASIPNPPVEPARQADGWVYVGTRAGLKWDEKYFNWDGEKDRLPEKGDILTATGSVHLRGRIGPQAHIVGVICPDEPVNVLRIYTVADGHHWVQVKRMQEKEQ